MVSGLVATRRYLVLVIVVFAVLLGTTTAVVAQTRGPGRRRHPGCRWVELPGAGPAQHPRPVVAGLRLLQQRTHA